MKKPIFLIAALLSQLFDYAIAQDRIELDGARIFGNKDSPNITYIVPWKDEKLEPLRVQPITNLFEEALAPIDRDVFVREVEYYELLQDKPSR